MNQSASTLPDWLRRIEQVHPQEIELGLERVGEVARRMGMARPGKTVITIAGTNGKGSCVAVMEHLLCASGKRVAAYTSPHLCRYNERVRIQGKAVDDAMLVHAFEAVEAARGDISLSYFEFGTLAALLLFAESEIDCALLEVGLGGRLDAVNIIDADVAVITSIQIDHTDWLGTDRESIGREKAGILRPGCTVVCADPDPPQSLLALAREYHTLWSGIGEEFDCAEDTTGSWNWRGRDQRGHEVQLSGISRPQLLGPNVAAALQALNVAGLLPQAELLRRELPSITLAGRFQRLMLNGIEYVLDVAHNPAGMQLLARRIADLGPAGSTLMVFGAMGDKDISQMLESMIGVVDAWLLTDIPGTPRAASAALIAESLAHTNTAPAVSVYHGVEAAMESARSRLSVGDRLLVCGSFHVVGPALEWLRHAGAETGVTL